MSIRRCFTTSAPPRASSSAFCCCSIFCRTSSISASDRTDVKLRKVPLAAPLKTWYTARWASEPAFSRATFRALM